MVESIRLLAIVIALFAFTAAPILLIIAIVTGIDAVWNAMTRIFFIPVFLSAALFLVSFLVVAWPAAIVSIAQKIN